MKKLKLIREQREKYRRFLAMREFHYGKSKEMTTPVQELRKNILLSSMMENCRH